MNGPKAEPVVLTKEQWLHVARALDDAISNGICAGGVCLKILKQIGGDGELAADRGVAPAKEKK